MKYDSIVGGAKQRGQEYLQKLGYNKNPDDIDLMNDVDLDSIRDPLLIDKENSKIVTDKYTPCPCEGVARYVDIFNGQKEGYIRNGLAGDDGSVYDQVQYSISASEWRTAVGGETSIFDNHMD